MSDSLLQTPCHETQLAILSNFFQTNRAHHLLDSHKTYFQYYEAELKRLRIGIAPPLWLVSTLAAKTHKDILHIASTLSEHRCSTRPQIREKLHSRFQDSDDLALNRSVDLALRLWLMLNVRDRELSVQTLQKPSICWHDDSTLKDFVASQFPVSSWFLEARESRLDPFFTAANMVRICGLKLDWTESLDDHLRLDRRNKVLSIYSYKSCLVSHLDSLDAPSADTKG